MKLKLSYADFLSMLSILRLAAMRPKEKDLNKVLTQIMIIRIFKKFHTKSVDVKKQYSIRLNEEEAIAFWLYFANAGLPVTSHTGNLIECIRSVIHQKLL